MALARVNDQQGFRMNDLPEEIQLLILEQAVQPRLVKVKPQPSPHYPPTTDVQDEPIVRRRDLLLVSRNMYRVAKPLVDMSFSITVILPERDWRATQQEIQNILARPEPVTSVHCYGYVLNLLSLASLFPTIEHLTDYGRHVEEDNRLCSSMDPTNAGFETLASMTDTSNIEVVESFLHQELHQELRQIHSYLPQVVSVTWDRSFSIREQWPKEFVKYDLPGDYLRLRFTTTESGTTLHKMWFEYSSWYALTWLYATDTADFANSPEWYELTWDDDAVENRGPAPVYNGIDYSMDPETEGGMVGWSGLCFGHYNTSECTEHKRVGSAEGAGNEDEKGE